MIQEATNSEVLEKCFPPFAILRPHLSQEIFVQQVLEQISQGYHLVFIEDENHQVVAGMGYRVLTTLAWGKLIYIDDLVSLPSARKQGNGKKLLEYAKEQARLHGCSQVHLDSGYQRQDAHRLYLNCGFVLSCHHFQCILEQ